MKKYKLSLFLLVLGVVIVVFSMMSIGNQDGLFEKVLSSVSIPLVAHLAWEQLTINLGMYIIHLSFFITLGISAWSVFHLPTKSDKWMFGVSLLFTIGILLLWTLDGSYPVPYNTLELIGH